ncbi:unnamed protein product [Vitrella brassicaformis CCMP3155]|uniref:Uncharacterized protein n=1 Tax=Vitrella brassicaformis (strain CCMP3155) TaxID=1169540 RepID=A0A0G4GS77_VITBC|nr:unnamed protein product [Vitrella brassicaformis CCMP3155]|eukprot:CEM33468.1 unnamed protein product [Vitrella brassicaformis CCMP3155]
MRSAEAIVVSLLVSCIDLLEKGQTLLETEVPVFDEAEMADMTAAVAWAPTISPNGVFPVHHTDKRRGKIGGLLNPNQREKQSIFKHRQVYSSDLLSGCQKDDRAAGRVLNQQEGQTDTWKASAIDAKRFTGKQELSALEQALESLKKEMLDTAKQMRELTELKAASEPCGEPPEQLTPVTCRRARDSTYLLLVTYRDVFNFITANREKLQSLSKLGDAVDKILNNFPTHDSVDVIKNELDFARCGTDVLEASLEQIDLWFKKWIKEGKMIAMDLRQYALSPAIAFPESTSPVSVREALAVWQGPARAAQLVRQVKSFVNGVDEAGFEKRMSEMDDAAYDLVSTAEQSLSLLGKAHCEQLSRELRSISVYKGSTDFSWAEWALDDWEPVSKCFRDSCTVVGGRWKYSEADDSVSVVFQDGEYKGQVFVIFFTGGEDEEEPEGGHSVPSPPPAPVIPSPHPPAAPRTGLFRAHLPPAAAGAEGGLSCAAHRLKMKDLSGDDGSREDAGRVTVGKEIERHRWYERRALNVGVFDDIIYRLYAYPKHEVKLSVSVHTQDPYLLSKDDKKLLYRFSVCLLGCHAEGKRSLELIDPVSLEGDVYTAGVQQTFFAEGLVWSAARTGRYRMQDDLIPEAESLSSIQGGVCLFRAHLRTMGTMATLSRVYLSTLPATERTLRRTIPDVYGQKPDSNLHLEPLIKSMVAGTCQGRVDVSFVGSGSTVGHWRAGRSSCITSRTAIAKRDPKADCSEERWVVLTTLRSWRQ